MFSTADQVLNLTDQNFAVAFQVNDFVSKKAYDDENMVKWLVKIVEGDGFSYFNNSTSKIVSVHKCTDEDWLKFFAPRQDKKDKIEWLQKQNTMFCLNKTELEWEGESLGLYGSTDFMKHRRLEIRFLPSYSMDKLMLEK